MNARTWIFALLVTTGCARGVAEPAPGSSGPLDCEMWSQAPDYVYDDERLGVDDDIHDLAALPDGTLYFVTGGDFASNPSSIMRLAPKASTPEAVAFDADLPVPAGDTLYFRCSGNQLCSSALSGGFVTTVAPDFVTDLHGPLLADDHAVYGLEGRSIVRVPFDGDAPTTLAEHVWVQDLDVTPWGAVGDGYVYFVDGASHALARVPATGGEAQTIVSRPITSLSGIAVHGDSLVYDADALYLLTLGTSQPKVIRFQSGGDELRGSPVTIDPASGAVYLTTMEGLLQIDAAFSTCSGAADEWIDAGPSSRPVVGRDVVYYTSVDGTAISSVTRAR